MRLWKLELRYPDDKWEIPYRQVTDDDLTLVLRVRMDRALTRPFAEIRITPESVAEPLSPDCGA